MSDADGRSLQVEQETLHKVAQDIRTAESDINGHLGTVRGAAAVLAGAWTGQAATAFTNLIQRWDADAKKLIGAMDTIAGLLDRSADRHELTDQDSMQMLNRVDNSVGSILNPNR